MRLHHLSVTAFGPFVDPVEVDFDTLSDAGLFLLSGATGSGKSSVLDAVCFALYGAVPGDRQHAGRLRSDQAPAGLAPRVSLEATLAGRRFRLVRSPAWERPKKRGSGTTREQARVSLSELAGEEWQPLTSRLDEAGDLVSGLLGMNLDQFCQVALLPQGQFQVFLRADSAQRHGLLSRLFRTGRFERVESWLRDHRLSLRRACDQHVAVVADLVSRLSEAAHRPVPDDLVDLGSAADEALVAWVTEIRDESAARRTSSASEAVAAAATHETVATHLISVRELAAARSRVVAAAETVERLGLEADRRSADEAALEQARRSAGLRPLVRLFDERQRRCGAAQARADLSREKAAVEGVDVDGLDAELDRVTDELASLTALLPAEQSLADLRERGVRLAEDLHLLSQDAELAGAEATAREALVTELEERRVAVDEARLALPAAEADVAGHRTEVAAHRDVIRLTAELESACADHAAARWAVTDLREHLLDLRERRIAGMAAELAGGLAVGDDCPVCGSIEHPHPARASGTQPDGNAEREAQRAVDDAQAVELAVRLRVGEVESALGTAREARGATDPEQTRTALSEAECVLESIGSLAADGDAVRLRLTETKERLGELAAAGSERRVRVAELTSTLEHLRAQGDELEARVEAARGRHPELRTAVAIVSARRDLLRAVRADADALAGERAALEDASTALGRAVLEAGFAAVEEARAAELSAADLSALEQSVQDHRTMVAAARQVLDEPDAWELLTTPAPDVQDLETQAREKAEVLQRCRAAEQVAARTDERIHRLTAELVAALSEWVPVRAQLALATRVASFAEGKAGDNRWQMRLSAYVLAYRLSQVVAAANGRLSRMSDQRYSLEHVGRRGAGETRGGLSLVVRDDWSGEARDPATLSGGETFVVSLALALGLADVVAHEAGGADLQTLFVDEGFGSLDAETLDDVLDILDSLREGGRAVGVVSHVPEMRHRIPAQLVVTKARTGSTVRVVG